MIAKVWKPLLRPGWFVLALALASVLPVYRTLKREAGEPRDERRAS